MTEDEGTGYLAERLNRLFNEVRRSDGKQYKLCEVACGVNTLAGRTLISVQYLSQLRHGQRRNPSYAVVDALACWFGVSTGYFSGFERQKHGSTDQDRGRVASA